EKFADTRMSLRALKFVEWRQVRIGIIEVDDETDRTEVFAEVIHEGSAARVVVERPAHGMHHHSRAVLSRRKLPHFFRTNAELLRFAPGAEIVFREQALRQRAARAFRKERVLAEERHAGRVRVFVMTVARDAHIAGDDAFHLTRLAKNKIDGGKTRVDLDAQTLGLSREPAAELAKTCDALPMIAHQGRHDEIRNAQTARSPEI